MTVWGDGRLQLMIFGALKNTKITKAFMSVIILHLQTKTLQKLYFCDVIFTLCKPNNLLRPTLHLNRGTCFMGVEKEEVKPILHIGTYTNIKFVLHAIKICSFTCSTQ